MKNEKKVKKIMNENMTKKDMTEIKVTTKMSSKLYRDKRWENGKKKKIN